MMVGPYEGLFTYEECAGRLGTVNVSLYRGNLSITILQFKYVEAKHVQSLDLIPIMYAHYHILDTCTSHKISNLLGKEAWGPEVFPDLLQHRKQRDYGIIFPCQV